MKVNEMHIGDHVINLNTIRGKIVGFREADGFPILYNPDMGKWIANPEKCEPELDSVEAFTHKDGMVIFG